MIPITISVTRRRWWGNQTKTWRRWLPQSWEDLPRRRRFIFWSLVLDQGEVAMDRIITRMLNIPGWAWQHMAAEDRAAIAIHFRWMQPTYDCVKTPFRSFRHRGITYMLPKPKFENGTCLEFVLADGYYNQYRKTEKEEHLLKLVATLCRPVKENAMEALQTGDERIPVLTKEQVEKRAAALKGLHPSMQVAVLLYFVGVKQYISETYWMLFQAPPDPEELEAGAEPETPGGPKFGWWSKFMQIGKTRLFGDYDVVLQKRLHLICMHLVDEHEIAEQARREHQRQISKYSTHDS